MQIFWKFVPPTTYVPDNYRMINVRGRLWFMESYDIVMVLLRLDHWHLFTGTFGLCDKAFKGPNILRNGRVHGHVRTTRMGSSSVSFWSPLGGLFQQMHSHILWHRVGDTRTCFIIDHYNTWHIKIVRQPQSCMSHNGSNKILVAIHQTVQYLLRYVRLSNEYVMNYSAMVYIGKKYIRAEAHNHCLQNEKVFLWNIFYPSYITQP